MNSPILGESYTGEEFLALKEKLRHAVQLCVLPQDFFKFVHINVYRTTDGNRYRIQVILKLRSCE
jgi:hypothetical protein